MHSFALGNIQKSHSRKNEEQPPSVGPSCRYTMARWELKIFSRQDMPVITKDCRHLSACNIESEEHFGLSQWLWCREIQHDVSCSSPSPINFFRNRKREGWHIFDVQSIKKTKKLLEDRERPACGERRGAFKPSSRQFECWNPSEVSCRRRWCPGI